MATVKINLFRTHVKKTFFALRFLTCNSNVLWSVLVEASNVFDPTKACKTKFSINKAFFLSLTHVQLCLPKTSSDKSPVWIYRWRE